ncbi:chemotaxis protein CheA [Spiribacter halobius]|uniref:Chemotaxis protein CheA n=1 Tax=Sediminicurvatus halobius TaxID=2182432 RepID=A0A2U2N379_9GAMM|nr:chemotaxis protein CheA [Spiribacter halobius]PWG63665.1 chemotaxis protein CheA [Spiribacter halobius]UEX79804.1 chemotaxis protein CheA [Spiribacter halobius]
MDIDPQDDIVQDFLVESREILESLGEQLVDLEQQPEDRDLLNAVFRGFHTIKGGAGFLALDRLVEICHVTEDIFNLLRSGEKTVDSELMDAVLQALDVVNGMFTALENGESLDAAPPELMRTLRRHNAPDGADDAATGAADPPAAPAASGDAQGADPAEGDISDREFEALLDALDEPAEAMEKVAEAAGETPAQEGGGDEIDEDEFEALLDELHGQGRHAGRPAAAADAPASAKPPDAPEAAGKAAAAASGDEHISEDEFEALLDELHGEGRGPGAEAAGASDAAAGSPSAADAAAPAASRASAGQEPDSKAEPAPEPEPKPASAGGGRGAGRGGAAAGGGSGDHKPQGGQAPRGETSVRVDTAKLDDIMNLVGELVLVRNRLATLRGELEDERLGNAVGNLELVTSDLQNAVMKTRMQPIKKVFGRFPRVVRDLARSLKKEVALTTRGEDTDLDKNLVEALADPLVHLVRNAVDHGMENPDERVAAGKPRQGSVVLSAEQEGDHILLSIADDGRGMDPEALRQKVVDKGLMDAESARRLDPGDCFNLIFLPGFSTKDQISDVSGRGVGMDVVKNSISRLNGSIDIDSKLGVGTTIRIKVPLTLAILPTLMVRIRGRKFALPMSVVREIFELDQARTNTVDGRLTVRVRGKAMPLFFLERWLQQMGAGAMAAAATLEGSAESEPEHQVVTVTIGHQTVGFVVDEVIGLEEVVIKPLGAMLHGLPGLAGSTITGDGRIALIIDIPSLIKQYGGRL